MAISPSGNDVAIASGHCTQLYQLNPSTASVAITSIGAVSTVAFVAGGQWLAIGVGKRELDGSPGSVSIWRMSDRKLMLAHNEPTGVWALAAAAEHKFVAWSSGSRRVTLRNLTRPDPHVFPALKKSATVLSMSPDARCLAAGDDWSIRLWDIGRRNDKATLSGHKGRVVSLAFAPDGRHLLSGGGDEKIITWDVETGQQEHVVDWELGRVTAVAISADGLLCAAGGDRGRIVVWDRD